MVALYDKAVYHLPITFPVVSDVIHPMVLLEDLVLSGDALALDISEHVLVLSSVPVRELVVASLPGLLGGVDLLNEVVGEVEVLESSEEVLNIDVLSAELGNPLKVVISDWLHTEIKF